jgi:hypothetical protein
MKKGDDSLPQVYEKFVEVRTSGVDVPIECKAFAFTKMLSNQTTKNQDDTVLFRLFDLTIPPSTTDKPSVLHDSCKHLRLDYLSG